MTNVRYFFVSKAFASDSAMACEINLRRCAIYLPASRQQRELRMDSRQVIYPQAPRVPVGHLQRTVAQDPLEVQHVPASPKVAHRKRVPKRVRAESDARDPHTLAQ